jgi:predicted neutral ceramidase superfamily lipid hydrolase
MVRELPNQRSARNLHDQILAGMSVHAFAHAEFAILREQSRLVILRDEIVEVVVRLQNHVTALPAVASVRTSFGTILLAPESHAALAAAASARVDFDFVNEHLLWLLILIVIFVLIFYQTEFKIKRKKRKIKITNWKQKGEAEAPPSETG